MKNCAEVLPTNSSGPSEAVGPHGAPTFWPWELIWEFYPLYRTPFNPILCLFLTQKKQDEAHEPECRHVCWVTETTTLFVTFSSEPTGGTPWLDTLRWHSCIRHPCLTLLRNALARHSCLTLLFVTFVGHSCLKLFWNTLTWHFLLGTFTWHSWETLVYDTLTWHSCKTLLLDTLM